MAYQKLTRDELLAENEKLRSRLGEAEDALNAIRNGEVDAIVVSGESGDQIFSLTSSETPYRILLEEMDEGALSLGADGTILYCNNRFASLISLPAEKIIGSNFRDFVIDRDKTKFDNLFKKGLKGKANDLISFSRDGSKSSIHLKLSLRELPSGLSGDVCIVASDVTLMKQQQEKLEVLVQKRTKEIQKANEKLQKDLFEIKESKTALFESENKYTSIYNSMSEGLALHELVYDDSEKVIDYIITDVNPAYEQIIGVKKKRVLGRKATDVYKSGTAPYLDIYSRVALTGNAQTFESYFPPMDKHFHISVFSPERGKFATVFQDISERKRTQEKLRVTLQRFYLMLSSMYSGLLLMTDDGEVEFLNQAFCKFYNLNEAPEKLIGISSDELLEKIKPAFRYPATAETRIREILKEGIPVRNEEFEMQSERHALRNFIPLNIQGVLHGRLWVHVDITERKLAEEELRKSEQLYRAIGESIDYGVWICDPSGKNIYASDSFLKMVGQTQEECSDFGWGNTLHPDDAEKTIAAWKECAKTGEMWDIEHRFKGVDGKWHPVLARGVPVRDYEGKIISWAGINLDISKIKQAEEALRESEERFRLAFNNSPDAITITRLRDGKIIEGNESVYTLLGYNVEEVVGKTTMELGIWADPPERQKLIKGLSSKGFIRNEYFVLRKKNGTLVPVNLSASLITINDEQCFIASFIDLTERKKAEEALRNSEERLRVTLTSIGDAVITVDTSGKVTFLNSVAENLTGWKQTEAAGQPISSIFRIINELTQIPSEDIFNRVLGEGRVIGLSNHTALVSKDGHQIPIEDSAAPIKDQSGKVIGVVLVFHDVTEKRRAQEALKESEKRFRNLAENTPDMILRFDKDLNLLYGNEAVLSQTGLQINSLEGKEPTKYSSGSESAKKWEEAARKVIKTGSTARLQQANLWKGTSLVYDILIVPEKDENGQVTSIISLARDVTEMKKAENILRVSEQRLKYHFENSPLAIVEWDKDFNIIRWSNEAERIFGMTRDEVIGVRIDLLNIIYKEDIPLVEKTMTRLTSGKESKVVSQNRNLTKTGKVLECIWYNSVLMDEKGEVSSVMSLIEDVSLLRQTEKELIENRESYKELVTNAKSIIIRQDNEGGIIFINEFGEDFFGYNKEELIGKKAVGTIVPLKESTGKDLEAMVESIIRDPDDFSININENIKKNGERVWVEWHNKTLYDSTGEKTGHIAIGIDVTNRRKAEEALIDSERKLKSVLNAANESIYMFDREGIIVMSNATGIRRLKRKEENEVVGHHFSEFMTPDLAKTRMDKIHEAFNSGMILQYEDERNSKFFSHSFYPVTKDKEVLYVVTYSTDITENKNAETNLRQSEDRFRTIAESLPVMISITRSSDVIFTFINEPFEKTFGYKKGDLLGKRLPDFYYYPEDSKFLSDILKVKGFVENMEIKVKKKDGTPFWIMISIRKINFMNEASYLTSAIDISESKKAQEELIRLNRTLDAQSKSSQAMMHSRNEQEYLNEFCKIIIEDCGHTMVWVGYAQNDKQRSVKPVAYFGFDKGYIDQMNITWDDSERGNGPTGTAIKTGKPAICRNMQNDPYFAPWRESAIKRGYASSVVLPLKSEGRAFGAISIYSKEPDPFSESEIDLLTELADDLAYGVMFIRLSEYEKEATRAIRENELRLKELIATKDKFFNIIAHDLKNPFTSLLGASELLFDNINQMTSENIKKLALILNDSAKSGYAILQNLLDWSRSQTGQLKFNPEKVNLKTIVNENIDNLQLQVNNKGIDLKSDLIEDLIINADKNMINTVLRNLLSNAVKYTFKDGSIRVMVSQEPGEIKLTVKDTGIGISKEKADSLFKLGNSLSLPGTAKEQGTGLGLKLCKEFTEKMGGNIWVESKVGKGSEFIFTIPVKEGVKA